MTKYTYMLADEVIEAFNERSRRDSLGIEARLEESDDCTTDDQIGFTENETGLELPLHIQIDSRELIVVNEHYNSAGSFEAISYEKTFGPSTPPGVVSDHLVTKLQGLEPVRRPDTPSNEP
ncbi:hypothetical protein AA14337_3195 [Acetobacter malorum DSM 14337]|uniref:Uncharacterized protein n=1 Tax=Acetobacter malorum DSM 14337 TaxID=1307910 RepID=A0ABQ0Q078_9PROT|nr:hypothetical protein [Acetobacter malorum]KXV05774.1 hypothetical protein AD930_11675 [Acetobacter malorum]GBQ85914.1 hypothetical protein AA14337_3195 [Acetobacter malorum DSM 14337]